MCLSIIIATIWFISYRQQRTITKVEIDHSRTLLHTILNEQTQSLQRAVGDNALWNELYDCVDKKDAKWIQIQQEIFSTYYGSDYHWVFNKKLELISSYTKNGEELPILPDSVLKEIFKNKKISTFYQNKNERIQLCGEIICRTEDSTSANPDGIYVAGIKWDKAFFAKIKEKTFITVELENNIPQSQKRGYVYFQLPVKDSMGNTLTLNCQEEKKLLANINHSNMILIMSLVVFSLFFHALSHWLLRKWIGNPLKLITNSLDKQDTLSIEPLYKVKSEFGTISILIRDFFEQQKRLKEEIRTRENAEQTLRNQRDLLKKIGDSIPYPISYRDKNDIYVGFNHEFEKYLQLNGREIKNKKASEIPPKFDSEILFKNDYLLSDSNTQLQYEDYIRYDENTIKYVIFNKKQYSVDERTNGILTTMIDITERVELENQIEQVNRCFLNFTEDPVFNINLITELIGKICGASCALYNKIEKDKIISVGVWNAPTDYCRIDSADGHICTSILNQFSDDVIEINDLAETNFYHTDPNIAKYSLMSYIGKVIKISNQRIGTLCVLFQKKYKLSEQEKDIFEILAKAISIEEQRYQSEYAYKYLNSAYEMINEIAQDLINANRITFEEILRKCFARIGYFLDVDRVFFLLHKTDYLSLESEWCNLGIPKISDFLKIIPDSSLPELIKQSELKEIFTVKEMEAFNLSESNEKEFFLKAGISSMICLPLKHDNELLGYFGITGLENLQSQEQTEFLLKLLNKIFLNSLISISYEEQLLTALENAKIADSAKNRFLSSINHELNTPLHGIMSLTSLAKNEIQLDELKSMLDTITLSSEKLFSTIEKVLYFSQIEEKSADKIVENFSLKDLLFSLKSEMENKYSKNISVCFNIHPSLPNVFSGVVKEVRMIIGNILDNAFKFTESGKVELNCDFEPGLHNSQILISISDTGIGINESMAQNLFKPFQQFDSTYSRRYGGIGLGLAVSKKLLESMNGVIYYHSSKEKGCIFTISFILKHGELF